MSYTVRVPDGPDWTITMYRCNEWLNSNWPGIKSPKVGVSTWDYSVDFTTGYMIYKFKDSDKAMLFKLAWGGQ